MNVLRTTLAIAAVVILCAASAARISASEDLTRAKDLYHAAAYDDALMVLSGMKVAPSETVEANLYRVLCLIALDRRDEAKEAMGKLIETAPLYQLPEEETSPRVRAMFAEVRKVLKPGGQFIVVGPNIQYAYREYWDFYDHYLPLSHLSLSEGLLLAGFVPERVIDRFLPYTMQGRTPTWDILIKLYLRVPLAWRFMGKQFLVVARKPG